MSSEEKVKELKCQLQQTVQRIDELQKGKAVPKKTLHQDEQEAWEDRRKKLEADVSRWQGEAQRAHLKLADFRTVVDRELSSGGWRLAPVAERLRSLVSSPSQPGQGLQRDAGATQHAATLPPSQAPPPGSQGSGAASSGTAKKPSLMI
ncbi:hypothetical protein WJX72_006768 [[Myrmecia] bisecta]|uniref:Uncharacterized protein n=1 Tax=[Myrmecia] bisecta TaxID=41462 RepID=A0AAW1Q9A7_9CHLO